MGELIDKTKGYTNDAIGNAKQGIGKAVGSKDLEVDGMLQEAKGEVQKKTGDVKGALGDKV